MSSSRFVILGAGGFVGRAIAAQATNVRSVSSREIDLTTPGAGEKLGQILTSDDTVIFASAITPDKGKDASAFFKNIAMVHEVRAALLLSKLAKVIYLSSDAVFAENLPIITEQTLPCPDTLYGIMHLAREKILEEVCRSQNIPLLILRSCAIFGPGDTHNSYGPNRFLRSAIREHKIKLFGRGEEMRPHIYIGDMVNLIQQAAVSDASGVFHAIPSPSLSFCEVAELVVSLKSVNAELEFLPRSGQPTHKHFKSVRLGELFPSFEFRSFRAALAEQLEIEKWH